MISRTHTDPHPLVPRWCSGCGGPLEVGRRKWCSRRCYDRARNEEKAREEGRELRDRPGRPPSNEVEKPEV